MHQIRNFFMQSVQRSQTVVLEVVNLVHGELQRRLNVSLGSSDVANDDAPSKREQKDLLEQFAVVTSEAEMVKRMRESQAGFNPVFMMFDSGSRGSRDQIRQLREGGQA
jgi:hypothetical protein